MQFYRTNNDDILIYSDWKPQRTYNIAGILDHIAALYWIQENIEDFGGEKGSVTVMGHGTGAACLHYLMTSDALPHGNI